MPRVNPYRPEFGYDYDDKPTTSGPILFVGLVIAIVVAAVMWASVSPPDTQPGATGTPNISEPATPAPTRIPSPPPGG